MVCICLTTMRTTSALVFATLVALAACSTIPVHDVEKKLADKEFVDKQLNILKLLHRIGQHSVIKDQIDVGYSYDIQANINHYKNPSVVKQFVSYYKKGWLPRMEPFSVYYEKHRDQAVLLFELLYSANDYDTFYKTACWARDRVNQGMFVYAFSIAVFHREDTQDIVLPPPYEIYPYLFVDHDVIQAAQKYRMIDASRTELHQRVIVENFTLHNEEQLLTYFREDVNLNTFYLYYHYYYPTWLNTTFVGKHFDHRGEQFYYIHNQIYARYFLERLSNDLPGVQPFVFNKPVKTPYNPHLRYQNGDEMPVRPANLLLSNTDLFYVSDIKSYERRVVDAIDIGYALDVMLDNLYYNYKEEDLKRHPLYHDEHGIEYLGDIIEGNWDTPHWYFYGSLFHSYRSLVGHIVDPLHKIELPPSALEHPETALRDPIHYQIWKRLEHIFEKYKKRLHRYTHDELNFEGIKVENVEVGKLYTYFEPYEFSLDSATYVSKIEEASLIDTRVHEHRLNHKPFTYNVEVTSDKDHDVYVRVYLGPKYDYLGHEYDLNERRKYFVELDRFPYHVKAGKNVIERNSQDSSIVAPTPVGFRDLYHKVKAVADGQGEFYIDKSRVHCGYPENLLIPKGKKGGMPFTFYVIVTPYVKQDEHDFQPYGYKAFSYCGVGPDRKYPDDKPLGFPFDRTIYSNDFYTPNMYFKDVIIFHKKYEEVANLTQ